MTIKDVLTMTTGILWDALSMPYTDTSSTCVKMEATDDWVKFVVEQPMAFDPGEKWEYSSGDNGNTVTGIMGIQQQG